MSLEVAVAPWIRPWDFGDFLGDGGGVELLDKVKK